MVYITGSGSVDQIDKRRIIIIYINKYNNYELQKQTLTMETLRLPPVEPLVVPPALEPVAFSLPSDDRKAQLREYLGLIGEADKFDEVNGGCEKPIQEEYQRTGYTYEQRKWIKVTRDGSQDLAPYPHIDQGERHLHHIYAQAFCQSYLGLSDHPELINHPHNGITLSKNSHVGPYIPKRNESRHPDVNSAIQNMSRFPDALKRVFEDHWKLARQGIKYWVDTEDEDMIKIATERTNKMRALVAQKKHGK